MWGLLQIAFMLVGGVVVMFLFVYWFSGEWHKDKQNRKRNERK